MTEKEKYINNLFKAARNELPKRSYKEVANHFEKTIIKTPIATGCSKSLLKYVNLNTLFMTTICSLIIAGFLWSNATNIEQTIPLDKVAETTKSEQGIPQQKEVSLHIQTKDKTTTINPTQSSILKVEKKSLATNSITQKVVQKKEASLSNPIIKTVIQKKEQLASLDDLSLKKIAKTASQLTIPSTTATEETTAKVTSDNITDNQTNTPSITKVEVSSEQSKLFRLTYTDNEKVATTFLEKIRYYGFSVTEKINRNSGKIDRINLHIGLYKGLDWKIKLKNFEVFELKILLDEYKDPIGLSYRLSDNDKFSAMISLKSRARSNHKFSKNNSNGHHSFTKYIKH